MSNPSAWATAREAASILGITRDAVYKQIATGVIPASALRPRVEGGAILISRSFLVSPHENVTPIRFDMRQENELIATLKKAVRDLQTENLTLATENLKLKAAANLRELQVA